jgi:hypothetical protein
MQKDVSGETQVLYVLTLYYSILFSITVEYVCSESTCSNAAKSRGQTGSTYNPSVGAVSIDRLLLISVSENLRTD